MVGIEVANTGMAFSLSSDFSSGDPAGGLALGWLTQVSYIPDVCVFIDTGSAGMRTRPYLKPGTLADRSKGPPPSSGRSKTDVLRLAERQQASGETADAHKCCPLLPGLLVSTVRAPILLFSDLRNSHSPSPLTNHIFSSTLALKALTHIDDQPRSHHSS